MKLALKFNIYSYYFFIETLDSGGEVELQCYHNWFSAVRSIFVELSNRTK